MLLKLGLRPPLKGQCVSFKCLENSNDSDLLYQFSSQHLQYIQTTRRHTKAFHCSTQSFPNLCFSFSLSLWHWVHHNTFIPSRPTWNGGPAAPVCSTHGGATATSVPVPVLPVRRSHRAPGWIQRRRLKRVTDGVQRVTAALCGAWVNIFTIIYYIYMIYTR